MKHLEKITCTECDKNFVEGDGGINGMCDSCHIDKPDNLEFNVTHTQEEIEEARQAVKDASD